ncbi:uncharacterized protein [Miscanthus floridulus]|uniref:uncharacterized protein n=1 Tax=Miscanthus floridulus TaxID=154761 RepID=UPI0034577345
MANNNNSGGHANGGGSTEYDLKKCLLLLATLVATVTYAAGLNLPGGSWLADTPEGQLVGDSILRHTNYTRYIVFYYFNAISFAASLLVGLLLLIVHQDDQRLGNRLLLYLVRFIMMVDMLGLMGAYGAGSSHDDFTTRCGACLLASGIFAYAIAWLTVKKSLPSSSSSEAAGRRQKQTITRRREIQLVLAVFAATDAYVAGLNPPGSFWRSTEEGHHTAGDPVLQRLHPTRYKAFFFFNTTAFVASLLVVMLIVTFHKRQKQLEERFELRKRQLALYGPIVIALLGLGGAYISGSCRDSKHTAYIVLLLVLVAAAISTLLLVAQKYKPACVDTGSRCLQEGETKVDWQKNREDIQLLPILAATISYTAGVDPPGGVWARSGAGHNVGDPILLTTHPVRYKVFFYFNSAALVASLVITAMLLYRQLVLRKYALEAVMILDLFALIGAYAAGGSRDASTSVYTVALAGVVLIYVVIHILFFTLDEPEAPAAADSGSTSTSTSTTKKKEEDRLKKKREVLLMLAILGATLAYQAGLTPPGGFWEEDDARYGHRVGFPVLQDKYPVRYRVFYYCNAASFMASVALIVLLRSKHLYRLGINCYALYVCMVAGMLGLMGAYSAGSSMHLKTSIIVLVLAAVLTAAAILVAVYVRCFPWKQGAGTSTTDRPATEDDDQEADMKTVLYLMLAGTLGASVTYLTGLKPPGGLWREDGGGHSAAGDPVLHDTGKTRYNVFFYSNSLSFMASISIIAALLLRMILQGGKKAGQQAASPSTILQLWPMYTAMLLDVLALLVAYAAGSARKWGTSTKVVMLLVPTLVVFCAVLFLYDYRKLKKEEAAAADDDQLTPGSS